jgi:DNA-nicking Smr family endonuclease
MSSKKKDDDTDAFRLAMAGVRPISAPDRIEPLRAKPPAVARQSERDKQSVMDELLDYDPYAPMPETGDELRWKRDGVQNRVFRRLRSGYYSNRDTVDLHGMNEETAQQVLRDFIEYAIGRGFGCVRIIHGKGLRSRGHPTLKRMTERVLRRHPRVRCYASCRPVDGGTGATDVLLSVKKNP